MVACCQWSFLAVHLWQILCTVLPSPFCFVAMFINFVTPCPLQDRSLRLGRAKAKAKTKPKALQRQGVYSVQAQYCHCHTKIFPNKRTIPWKPKGLHLVLWRVLDIVPEAPPPSSGSIATRTSAQPVRCIACKFRHLHRWLQGLGRHHHTSTRWFLLFGLGPWKEGSLRILNEHRHDNREQKWW